MEAVGENAVGFKKGDRVAELHEMMTPHGAFAEYAIAPYYTTFHIPNSTSFEEAATIPLAAYTSVCALFQELEIPEPWSPIAKAAGKNGTKRPLIVYGASTATGAYAIKLAAAANVHPIIAIGSKRSEFVNPFLDASKGDTLVGIRRDHDLFEEDIETAPPLSYLIDIDLAQPGVELSQVNTGQHALRGE